MHWIRYDMLMLGACSGVPVDLQVSFRLLISRSIAEVCLIKVGRFFAPQPVGGGGGGKCLGEFGPNFSNSSHK